MNKKPPATARPAPPASITKRWDKAKWHIDGERARGVSDEATYAHLVAAFEFLRANDLLTSAGKAEAKTTGADLALLANHVKVGARAFLDEAYDAYLRKSDRKPAIALLERALRDYAQRFDLAKKPRTTAFVALMQRTGSEGVDDVLGEVGRRPELLPALRAAIDEVPTGERPLVAAVLALHDADPGDLAARTATPELTLRALRYASIDPVARLRAAARLLERSRSEALEQAAHAVNLRTAWMAVTSLDTRQAARLASTVNRLFERGGEGRLIAMCAMRNVGDAESQRLVETTPPDDDEAILEDFRGRRKPAWNDLRREAVRLIKRRLATRPRRSRKR